MRLAAIVFKSSNFFRSKETFPALSKILEIEDVEKNITAKLNKWPIVCLRFRELWRQKVSLQAVSRTDVRKLDRETDRQLDRQTERQTEKQKERQKDFSAYSSKQKLFRMSTGCQKDRKIDRNTDRQTDGLTD